MANLFQEQADVPLTEPENAPHVFLDGCEFEIKNGLLYIVGWQQVTGGCLEERRIVCRGVIPLVVAVGLHKEFAKALFGIRKRGH